MVEPPAAAIAGEGPARLTLGVAVQRAECIHPPALAQPVDERAFRMTLGLGGDGASVRPDEVLRAMFGEEGRSATLLREELGAARAERAPG